MEATVRLDYDKFHEVKDLLEDGENFDGMTYSQKADFMEKESDSELIFEANFEDGSSASYSLRSRDSNYWEELVWYAPIGSIQYTFEPDCWLDREISFFVRDTKYVIKIELV